jgi:hypothetical protein
MGLLGMFGKKKPGLANASQATRQRVAAAGGRARGRKRSNEE